MPSSPRRLPESIWIGPADHAEFRDAARLLAERTRSSRFEEADKALEYLQRSGPMVELIVFGQARPGRFTPSQVDRLRRAAPLAALVGLLSSRCEGMLRGGGPWPGVTTLYWYQWEAQAREQLERIVRERFSLWQHPGTTTENEKWLRRGRSVLPRGGGLVAILARGEATAQGLADVCRRAGYSTVVLPSGRYFSLQGVEAVLLDAPADRRYMVEQIEQARRCFDSAPILVLVDFPRWEDWESARRAGARAILGKPLFLDDLCLHLVRLTDQPPRQSHQAA